MAETIKIDLDIDAGSSLKTMGDLEASVESMMDELKQTDVASNRFKELQGSIAGANSEIKNMELSMEGLDMEQKSSEMGSFAAGMADTATGALALSGAMGLTNDSSEKMIESLVSGMAVAQTFRGGLDGIVSAQKLMRSSTIAQTAATGGATIAQRILNSVMKANPIFILIGLIVSAVAAFALFSSASEEAKVSTEDLNEAEEELIATLKREEEAYKNVISLRESRKGIRLSKEQLELERQILFAQDELADVRRNSPDDIEKIISAQQKLNNLTLGLAQRKKQIALEEAVAQDIANNDMMNFLMEQQTLVDESTAAGKTRANELVKEIEELAVKQQLFLESKSEREIKESNKVTKVRIANENIIADLRNKPTTKDDDSDEGLTEQEKIDKKLEATRRWSVEKQTILVEQLTKGEITEKEFTAKSQELLRDRLDKEKAVLETYNLNLVDKNLEIAENNLEIQKRLDDEELARKKALDDKIVESEMTANQKLLQDSMEKASKKADVAKGYANSVNSLAQGIFEIQNNLGDQDSDAKEKRAKKQFKVQKAMNLGMAIIDGFKAITSSLAMAPLAIGPIPNPAGIASLALAATTSAINIAKIASTKYEGGGGGAGPTAPTLSIASPDIRETPSTNLFGQGNEGSEGDSSQFSSQEQGGPTQIQAVVSWSDIDAVQNNDNNIQQEMQL